MSDAAKAFLRYLETCVKNRRKPPRERLAERLQEAGYSIDPHDIIGAKGYWRIQRYRDDTTVCWEANAFLWGLSVHLVSYDTMTDCARYGVVIHVSEGVHEVMSVKYT